MDVKQCAPNNFASTLTTQAYPISKKQSHVYPLTLKVPSQTDFLPQMSDTIPPPQSLGKH